MCSTISIPIFPKIPKIILRKLSDQFGDFGNGYSAKNWEMWQLLRLIQWRLHVGTYLFGDRFPGTKWYSKLGCSKIDPLPGTKISDFRFSGLVTLGHWRQCGLDWH